MTASDEQKSAQVPIDSKRFIPGGVSSLNRLVSPEITFSRGAGAYMWDTCGKRYVDFHAAFAPHLLGHNHEDVNTAIVETLRNEASLFGAGPTELEAELAQILCQEISAVEMVTFLNTGSEAVALALRLSRAVTGRDHFIVMQGGYNGNNDELACNVFNSLNELGPRVSPGEYPILPLGAGTTFRKHPFVHIVNFNDLDSVRYVCERFPVAAVITEPVLQNIGVVLPEREYLNGLQKLAEALGFFLILDEVKTGFRQGIGGYSEIASLRPDLVVYGKALANGYPIAMLGGKAKHMAQLAANDPNDRPLLAGTYNGHPVGIAAAIATAKVLKNHGNELFARLETLGELAENGLAAVFERKSVSGVVSRLGSAFAFYFMDHRPVDFHDLLIHHDFSKDLDLRRRLVQKGIYLFPVAAKQCSISTAHNEHDIEVMVERFSNCLNQP